MSVTASDLRDRLEFLLMDMQNLTWDANVLDEGLRQALAQLSLATGQPVSVAGLDGAAETTLSSGDEALIVLGAAGFAALSRMAGASARLGLSGAAADRLLAWGRTQLARFDLCLAAVRLRQLQSAGSPPYSTCEETPCGSI